MYIKICNILKILYIFNIEVKYMINLENIKNGLLSNGYISDEKFWIKKIIESNNSKNFILVIDWPNNPEFDTEFRHSIELYLNNNTNFELIHTFYITESVINSNNFFNYLKKLEVEAKSEINQWKFEKNAGY